MVKIITSTKTKLNFIIFYHLFIYIINIILSGDKILIIYKNIIFYLFIYKNKIQLKYFRPQ